MERLIRSRVVWISTVCKCMSEFTLSQKFPDFTLNVRCNLTRQAHNLKQRRIDADATSRRIEVDTTFSQRDIVFGVVVCFSGFESWEDMFPLTTLLSFFDIIQVKRYSIIL